MKKFVKFIFKLLLILIIAFVGIFFGKGYWGYLELTQSQSVDDVVNEVTSRSTFVGYDDLSPELVRATVAIEDRRFYDHGGVDYIGLMRALVSQLDDNLLKSAYALTETLSIQNKLFKEFCSEEDIEKIKEKTKEIKNDKNGFKIGEIPKDNIDDKIICFESFSGSYLETSIKCIRDTERELNKRLIDEDYITLNEFLESLGHDGSEIGDKFRWSKEMDLYIDLDLDARISEKGEFVLVINHNIEPVYCGL